MNVLNRIKKKQDEYGTIGLLDVICHKYFGFPKILLACPPKLKHPVRLRFCTTDVLTYHDIIIKEDYSFGLPPSPKIIVDAGANIGMVSIYYATRFPNARIFAIEAERSNFEMLQNNVRGYPNITPIRAALWHSEGYISVTPSPYEPFSHWGFIVNDNAGDVPAVTIPSLMRDFGLDYIDFLKVNIEGAEKDVFEKCSWQDWIGSVVIELHDHFRPGCTEVVDLALKEFSQCRWNYLTWFHRKQHPSEPVVGQ
jgi:FkbM family methyltransferase